ncbi:MAG: MFS transporter [Caldimonas sp.]
MTTTNTFAGKAVLTFAHVAGMVDMVALPVWIGLLVQHYGYNAQQAGITVTLFLAGVVAASLCVSPNFNRWPRKAITTGGFALAGLAFLLAARQPVAVASFQTLALLHVLAGVGVGCGLSFAHGSIGRSANPHRLFAVANVVLGVFAVLFLGGVPQLVQGVGATSFFIVCAVLMAVATVAVAVGFPQLEATPSAASPAAASPAPTAAPRIPAPAWIAAGVVVCLTLNQAMVFSFVERIGIDRGFGIDGVNGVLIALGLVNLTPGLLAALLQKRLSPLTIGVLGPIGQAMLALTIVNATSFAPYAVATCLYTFMVIFTHAFLFGLLARLDPSGRAVAATPAMMMIGSAIGPGLAGALVYGVGYHAVGWAATGVALIAVIAMTQVRRLLPGTAAMPVAAIAARG